MPVDAKQNEKLSKLIIENAAELGFLDCGISKAEYLPDDEKRMEQWLTLGYNGDMSYLERNKEKRYDPSKLVDNAQSIITVLYNYFPHENISTNNSYQISKYAYGTDYHYVVKEKLRKLNGFIEKLAGTHNSRIFVDSAPVLDRAWAKRGGLGFIGKNTMLINKKAGSFFFIGHIITDLKLQVEDTEELKNYCGSCTRCIDACPTQAIVDGKINANECISYLTIEYRGELDESKKEKVYPMIFGCDICQDVCPWNRFSKPHNEPLFIPSDKLKNMTSTDWQNLDKQGFNNLFKNSAVQRTRYKGLRRNINFLRE